MSTTKECNWTRNPKKLFDSLSHNRVQIPTLYLRDQDRRKIASLLFQYGFRPKTVLALTGLTAKIVSGIKKLTARSQFPCRKTIDRSQWRKIRTNDHDYLLWRYFHWSGPWLPFLNAIRNETGIEIDELLAFYIYMVSARKRYDLRNCSTCQKPAPLRPGRAYCPACVKSGRAAHKRNRIRSITDSPFSPF